MYILFVYNFEIIKSKSKVSGFRESDFGNYSCKATTPLGTAVGVSILSGQHTIFNFNILNQYWQNYLFHICGMQS